VCHAADADGERKKNKGKRMNLRAAFAVLILAAISFTAKSRELFEDYDTQIGGSDQIAALGPDLFRRFDRPVYRRHAILCD